MLVEKVYKMIFVILLNFENSLIYFLFDFLIKGKCLIKFVFEKEIVRILV